MTKQFLTEDELTEMLARFTRWLGAQDFAPKTKKQYQSAMTRYFVFVFDQLAADYAAISAPKSRDAAIMQYRNYLKLDCKLSHQTINRALTAIGHFYACLGQAETQVPHLKQPTYKHAARTPLDRFFVAYTPDNLRSERQRKGYSLRKLAELSSKSYDYLCDLENDKYDPTLEFIRDLGQALDIIFTVGEGPLVELDPRVMKIHRQGLKFDGKKMSLRKLAALTDISYTTVRDFEHNRARQARVSTTKKLSRYYGLRFFLL